MNNTETPNRIAIEDALNAIREARDIILDGMADLNVIQMQLRAEGREAEADSIHYMVCDLASAYERVRDTFRRNCAAVEAIR